MIEPLLLSLLCESCDSTLNLAVSKTVRGHFLGTVCTQCDVIGVINTVNSIFYKNESDAQEAYDRLLRSDLTVFNKDTDLTNLHGDWSVKILAHKMASAQKAVSSHWKEDFQTHLKDDGHIAAAKMLYHCIIDSRGRKEYALSLVRECLGMARIAGALDCRNALGKKEAI